VLFFLLQQLGILVAALEGLKIRVGFEAMPSRLPFDLAFLAGKLATNMEGGMVRLKG